ncbi:MAG: dihydroneopterin aldolase [Chloroflexi bacterium]|jgi:D-erythro-7,8-dihydroneopterin triphosphate epimerase|nr:dihydroneopterin aldolase [Chloroflexota bacterium]MBT4074651.1 dihydroneopterin aldolase [Chloroflexota bacterium]MBT4515843.1 dihydroneopterin aldolase [Chloroflexota bacterium]MBT5320296.1 dihydroneopterin aldolase [Chloroflexota bacterium]MBT6683050.1 dihydroneopterin aldolase [Chloroflexota bacterium]
MSTDQIHITGLRVECIIGINDWERVTKQEVVIDITLYADLTKPGESDDIEDTVNYRDISKSIQAHVEASSYGLIEAMARNIATICLEPEAVIRADVSVQKPGALRGADSVGVEISRSH